MRPRTWFIIVISLSPALIGCKPSTPGPAAVYSKITLGMPFNDAKALTDGEGDERSYDNLPSFPKPREIYSKLPISTQWLVLMLLFEQSQQLWSKQAIEDNLWMTAEMVAN